jgi:acetylornithine deacetylase
MNHVRLRIKKENIMDDKMKKKIDEIVERNKEGLIEMSMRLINIPSVTGNEFEIQNEVMRIMADLGMEIDAWEPAPEDIKSPLFANTNENFERRPVVAGILKGTGGGRSLLINGHVDVVTEQPVERWDTDPFKGVIKGGRLYGRGASDMKCGLAAGLFSVGLLNKLHINLSGDLTILSVPGEENGGNGTAAAVLRGYCNFDGAIYPEPTSNNIQPSHRGAAFWRIHITGKASHGGTKYKGVSAVEKGMLVERKLRVLERFRNDTICSKHRMYRDYPLSAPVTLGMFNGGQFTSSVPESCVMEGCIEYVPGEKSEDVKAMFEKAIMQICNEDSWMKEHPPVIEWFGLLYEPAETNEDHPLVMTAAHCFKQMLGKDPVINGFEAGTDMRLLSNNYGVPGIMFGPGDIMMAHAPNEYVEIEKLINNAKVMLMFISQWCGIDLHQRDSYSAEPFVRSWSGCE